MAWWARSAGEHDAMQREKIRPVSAPPACDEMVRVLAGVVWPCEGTWQA